MFGQALLTICLMLPGSLTSAHYPLLAIGAIPQQPWCGHSAEPSRYPAIPSSPQSRVDWVQIPNWLAGTWQTNSEVILYSHSHRLRTTVVSQPVIVRVKRRTTIGVQKDQYGNVWHYAGGPYYKTMETDSYKEVHQIYEVSSINYGDFELTTNTQATVARSDSASGQLLDVFLEQTQTTYSYVDDGVIEVRFLIKDMDLKGNPFQTTRAVCIEKRARPFVAIDADGRGDLRAKFREFLIQNQKRK
jgi:hypothetical protein